MRAALRGRWSQVKALPVLAALDPEAADLAILADTAFENPAVVSAALKAIERGQRVAVLTMPGASVAVPDALHNRVRADPRGARLRTGYAGHRPHRPRHA